MSISDRLYDIDLDAASPVRRRVVLIGQGLVEVGREFNKDNVVIRASGLAYTTLLALVPLLTIVFSMFTAFAAFQDIRENLQATLFSYFMPAQSDQIMEYMNSFMSNTTTLTLFGTIGLLVTTIMLFQNIEKTINALWHVTDTRSLVQRFIVFTAVLVWGTAFIGAGFYMTGKIRASLHLDVAGQIGFFGVTFASLAPLLLSVFAFAMFMIVVPSVKVRFRSALVGGVTGAALWEIAKGFFANWATGAVNYSVIYGSLALIPIFLIWLYLTWIIVLFATEVTYVHQNFNALMRRREQKDCSLRERIYYALRTYLFIAARFKRGDGPASIDEIQEDVPVAVEVLHDTLDKFVAAKIIAPVEHPAGSYLPARDLADVRVHDVIAAVYTPEGEEESIDGDGELGARESIELMRRFEAAGFGAVGEVSIARAIEDARGASASNPPPAGTRA
ncbi:YihY family inner membrane protein [bacterium]|nr:YihY family inner membrane protein [bacterium]